MDRRTFLKRGALMTGGLVIAGPLQAYAQNAARSGGGDGRAADRSRARLRALCGQSSDGTPDRERGIREFVVGTGGKDLTGFSSVVPNSALRQASAFGVLELTLRPDGYDWRFASEAANGFTDSGSDGCGGSLPDVTAPSSPTGLTASATGSSGVDLAWKASTDDDGVSAYRVIRDGEPVATTTHTRYSDAELQPDTAYEYRVIALDPAGNASPRRRRPPSGRSGRTRSSSSRATTPRSGRTSPARLTGRATTWRPTTARSRTSC